jgi:hypothetical protein
MFKHWKKIKKVVQFRRNIYIYIYCEAMAPLVSMWLHHLLMKMDGRANK